MTSQLSAPCQELARVYSAEPRDHNSALVIVGRRVIKYTLLIAALMTFVFALADDAAQTVRCHEIAFSKSVEARDAATFASFIDADARFVGSSVMRGPVAIAEAWSVFFSVDGPEMKWRPEIVEVLDDGKLALTRGPYRMIASDDEGNRQEHWGTFNSVWRLQSDGQWKVVFDAGSASEQAPPEEIQILLGRDDDCHDENS